MIEIKGACKSFLSRPVLDKIDLRVPSQKSIVILGQSGSGKSVLLKMLAGLILPDEGIVHRNTENIGMLFQKNALFDSLTVYENLEFPLRERSQSSADGRKAKVHKFLKWVGLENTQSLFPDELSGGMQKRLGIARALIVEPELLFYDEPTAGLDPITSRKIADLILSLRKQMQSTLVTVTSDVQRAYQLADQIYLLVRTSIGSQIISAGTPDQARQSTDPRVQQFLKGLTIGPLTSSQPLQATRTIGAGV